MVGEVNERPSPEITAATCRINGNFSLEKRKITIGNFRGLRHLKERLGPRLEEAIILHTGEHAYTHDDWIRILPLDRLWA
jgi:hypothetical protein